MNPVADARITDHAAVITLLQELSLRLERLLARGEGGFLDLGRAPMNMQRRRQLRDQLGNGRVSATTTALGLIRVEETAIGGVWWISHHDRQGNLLVELIEIAHAPSILETQPQDIRRGLERIAELTDAPSAPLPASLTGRLQSLGLLAARPVSHTPG